MKMLSLKELENQLTSSPPFTEERMSIREYEQGKISLSTPAKVNLMASFFSGRAAAFAPNETEGCYLLKEGKRLAEKGAEIDSSESYYLFGSAKELLNTFSALEKGCPTPNQVVKRQPLKI